MRLGLSITTAPWLDDRAWALARLLARINPGSSAARAAGLGAFHLETTKGPNWKWGEAQWQWAIESECDAVLFLQDDQLCPLAEDFWPIVSAMARAAEGKVVGLHTRHPEATGLLKQGRHWISTTEMVGTGYIFWREPLVEFRAWRASMGAEWVRAIDEDTSIGEGWSKMNGKRIYHPIPTIIDHDEEIPSTADNDNDPQRRPTITWEDVSAAEVEAMKSAGYWKAGLDDAPHYILHGACYGG